MDKLKLFPGGFPMDTKTLNFLQDAHSTAINALTALGGDTFILKGVKRAGSKVSAGTIVYKGEILPFRGGNFNATVSIFEDIQMVAYNQDADNDGNLDEKQAYIKRYAKCSTGGLTPFPFDLLKPFTPLSQLSTPIGSIIMWSGAIADIPKGWALCDGTHGTPQLTDRFIVGAGGDYNIGDQGGDKEIALTEAQMPEHQHNGSTERAGKHKHTGSTTNGGLHSHTYKKAVSGRGYETRRDDYPYSQMENDNTEVSGSHYHYLNMNVSGEHTHTLTIETAGDNQAHENRPPYFALAYIMFKGF